jgi:hypothetical protein
LLPDTTIFTTVISNACAVASYGKLALEGKWLRHWKDRIDRRFMTKYNWPPRNSQ